MKKLLLATIFIVICFTLLFTGTKQAKAAPVLNPVNGNYYELFRNEVGWLEAKALAESQTYMGLQGHLATITSQNENDFVSNNFVSLSQDIWLGGFQPLGSPEPDGNWQWVTGEPWVYTNWFPGEPNDSNQFFGNNEEHLEIRLNLASQWNDQNLNIGRFYLVEWDTSIPEPIAIDIKPQSCPNPLNVKSKGVLPVAILGTADLDVTDIDITSLRLNGVAPVRSSFEDVATPTGLEPCDCLALSGDGTEDLTLKFDKQTIVADLGDVQNGEEITLMLTGMLQDGVTEIEGSDCVVIKGVKTAQIISLWPVKGAQYGKNCKLWAKLKNTGSSALPSNAKVWFWVTGPGWSGSHWVGSASVASLAAGGTKWYSFDWLIPPGAKPGTYKYWTRVYANGDISDWSKPQTFSVTDGNSPTAEVISTWKVNGAQCGQSAKLWEKIENTGTSALPSNAKVWYFVQGPGFRKWVGSVSASNLAPGATKWYSFNWPIPSGAQAGTYEYRARVYAGKAISPWSFSEVFSITCP